MTTEERPRSWENSDDPATVAASEELKHTSISEKSVTLPTTENAEPAPQEVEGSKKESSTTPDLAPADVSDEEMRERLSSPKKKRGRDQDDDGAALRDEVVDDKTRSVSGGTVNGNRPPGVEPQKKRVRDGSEDRQSDAAAADVAETSNTKSTTTANVPQDNPSSKTLPTEKSKPQPETSSSAFASSGFASLAGSTTSPFGAIGASKPSVFGGGSSSTTSGFGALAGSKSPPMGASTTTSGFGALSGNKPSSGFGFGSATQPSGFGGLGSGSVFGSALGNGFGGGAGSKLSSFAAPAATGLTSKSKIVKAFGAPDSDEEEDTDGDDDEKHVGSAEEDGVTSSPEEKKKSSKTQKVPVEDGESGEATLLHIRAKLFAIASQEAGWKERGVGTLKINVPEACVAFDDDGHAIPGSFDRSALEDLESAPSTARIPRLILRQENTHRVILNTALLKNMVFKDKPAASSAQMYFTAIEGEKEPKPVNMLLKMTEANAELFRREVESIQSEL